MDKSFEIADVIVAFIKGVATRQQVLMLDEWLGESVENRRLFTSLMDESTFEQRVHEREIFDIENVFKLIKEKKDASMKHRRLWYVAVAASVAILLLIGGMWIRWEVIPKTSILADLEYISGGTSKAFLTLSNGKQMILDRQDTLLRDRTINIRIHKRGEVSYEMGDSIVPFNMEYNTMETPRGGEFQLVLSDGTRVWLNAGSKLRYPVNFMGEERRVMLTGEAYFAVKRDEQLPFVVQTSRSSITVLGTEFCVRDYAEGASQTTLVKGSVLVKDPKGKSYLIKPGQQVYIDRTGSQVLEVEPIYFTAWKDGYFIFDQATIEEIMSELSKWYDFNYFFRNASVANMRLTARLKKYDDINVILDILSRTGDIHFTQKGRVITIENLE